MVQHTYDDDGNYLVTLRVEDDNGGKGTANHPIDIRNVAPEILSVDADPGDLPAEGGISNITVDATDVPGDVDDLLYSFDCNGNGSFGDAGDAANQVDNQHDCTFTAADIGSNTVNDQDGGVADGFTIVNVGVSPDQWNALLFVEGDIDGNPLQGGPDLDFGINPDALGPGPGIVDPLDEPFIESPGQELFFFFRYPESDAAFRELTRSKIPPPETDRDILEWPVRIKVELDDDVEAPEGLNVPITLRWDINPIPDLFQTALLIDHGSLPANEVTNMGPQSSYQFVLNIPQGDDRASRDLTIAVSQSIVQAMQLFDEWNLVALTVLPDSSQPDDILSDVIALSVLRWDPDAGVPSEDRRRRLTRATDFDEPMLPGLGFWVFVIGDSIQLIPGDPILETARGSGP